MRKYTQLVIFIIFLVTGNSLHAAGPVKLNDFPDPASIMPGAGTPVIVDFAQRQTGQKSMSGFLSGLLPDAPKDEQIRALNPRLMRGDATAALILDGPASPAARYGILSELGASYTLVISNVWGYSFQNYKGNGPPAKNLAAFRKMVRDLAIKVRDRKLSGSVVFDVWNEPDTARFSAGTERQHLQVYLAAERAIHAVLPNALVAGPSFSTGFDTGRIRRFLDFCLDAGCEVNVLTWHELLGPGTPNDPGANISEVADHLRMMRRQYLDNPRYASLKLQRIHINEYVGRVDQYRPGEIVAYLSALERGGADAAAKSCWDRVGGNRRHNNCFNGSLDGLFGPDGKGLLAPWWVYKTYAAGVGRRVASQVGDPRLAVLAGQSAGPAAEVQILVGHTRLVGLEESPEPAPVLIEIRNLDTAIQTATDKQVRVVARRIPDAGEEPVTALKRIFDRQMKIGDDGILKIDLGKLRLHEALIVSIQSARKTRISPD